MKSLLYFSIAIFSNRLRKCNIFIPQNFHTIRHILSVHDLFGGINKVLTQLGGRKDHLKGVQVCTHEEGGLTFMSMYVVILSFCIFL